MINHSLESTQSQYFDSKMEGKILLSENLNSLKEIQRRLQVVEKRHLTKITRLPLQYVFGEVRILCLFHSICTGENIQ